MYVNDQFTNLSQSELKLTALNTLLFNFLKKSFNESNTHHMFVIESLHLYEISSFFMCRSLLYHYFVVGVSGFNTWIVFVCFKMEKWMNEWSGIMNNKWLLTERIQKRLPFLSNGTTWQRLSSVISHLYTAPPRRTFGWMLDVSACGAPTMTLQEKKNVYELKLIYFSYQIK